MPRNTSNAIPQLRLHKATGQGFVRLNGKTHYLGRYDRAETRERYAALLAEWEAGGRRLPTKPHETTVAELCAAFWQHAEDYYRKPDGTLSTEPDNYRQAMKPLRALYGRTAAKDFGPKRLKAVRVRMVDKGWARSHVNQQTARARSVFKWGVAEELVPPSVYHGLQAVSGLKRGRTPARETDPVRPVPDADIEAVLPHLNRHVAAMVDLQRLTGMRPGEMVIMRTTDLDTGGNVWTYTPQQHKTAHHGHGRTVYLGPRAQDVLRPFLKQDLSAYCFSPREAEAERRERRHRHRETPLSCGNRPGSNRTRKPKRTAGERYTRDSYRRAVHRACREAGVPQWGPNRLRHNAATMLRREHGIDLAQTILGHRLGSAITEIYAEANVEKAKRVMARVG